MTNEEELFTKVKQLLQMQFGDTSSTSMRQLFDRYDKDRDGKVNKDELGALLKAADVGTGLTRGMWVSGIIDKLDGDRDGKIAWAEFERAMGL